MKSRQVLLALMDMWKPFRTATQAHAAQAAILFDKFHVMRNLGEALDQVRKSEHARLSGKDRRFIKGQKYTLLSNRENLTLEGRQARPGPDRDAPIRRDLRRCHAQSRGTYGRPRLVIDLRELGHAIGPKRVARLMREESLRGKVKGRVTPRTTDSAHPRPVAENLLARQFEVTRAPPAWVSDITDIETREGWLRGDPESPDPAGVGLQPGRSHAR